MFSIFRHNVCSCFYHRWHSHANVCQFSSQLFTCTCQFYIVQNDMELYCSIWSTALNFLKSHIPQLWCISLCNSRTEQPVCFIFCCHTITHLYTDFQAYHNVCKTQYVQWFCSLGHIYALSSICGLWRAGIICCYCISRCMTWEVLESYSIYVHI